MTLSRRRSWQPSKFVIDRGTWRPAPDVAEVARGSRFVASILADVYESAISAHAKGSLLDVGCGKAPLYGMYGPFVDASWWVDWPQSVHRYQRMDVAADLNSALPFRSGTFDTILLTDVLEHLAEPDIIWSELSRLLRPNGRVIVGVPFLYWLHEVPHDYYRYTEHALRRFCDRYHLTIERLEPYGGAPEVIVDLVCKHVAQSAALSLLVLRLGTWFVRSRLGRRLSDSRARLFPLGYILVAKRRPEPKDHRAAERDTTSDSQSSG